MDPVFIMIVAVVGIGCFTGVIHRRLEPRIHRGSKHRALSLPSTKRSVAFAKATRSASCCRVEVTPNTPLPRRSAPCRSSTI